MKTLIVYYSRTGNTRKLAQAIAAELGAAVEEIVESKSRAGILGWLGAGRDAMLRRTTPIQPLKTDPARFDLVVVGTPVWGWSVTPAVRAFLASHAGRLKSVAFFCTQGGSGYARAFRQMEELSGKKPLATLALLEKELAGDFTPRVREFAAALQDRPGREQGPLA